MTPSHGTSPRTARGAGAQGVPDLCMLSSSLLPESRRTNRDNDAVRRTAIVDLGSNSFRLVVFRYEVGGAWAVWDEIREPVRLSAGMGSEEVLRHGPVARALDTVRTFVAFCAQTEVDDVLAVGTSALRDAANGAEVVAGVQEAGLEGRVLHGGGGGYYGGLGVLHTTTGDDRFGLDIGGGRIPP